MGDLQARIRAFVDERDWSQYHAPRNLLLALVGEVGELVEPFQWRDDEQVTELLADEEGRSAVEAELADVFYYLLRLSDVLDVDLGSALVAKLEQNEHKYPAERARGSSAKYTAYEQ
jgi:dCTP diphosphatase